MASFTRSLALRQAFSAAARPQSALRPVSRLTQQSRVAAFHATARKAILPPLPQAIAGSVNDPQPLPPTSPSHGSYHWTFERLVSVGLIPLTAAPFIGGSLNPITDSILCALLVIHSHIGFDACITDYFPNYRTPGVKKALEWVLRACTVLVGVSLYEFETNDVGLTAAVGKIWKA